MNYPPELSKLLAKKASAKTANPPDLACFQQETQQNSLGIITASFEGIVLHEKGKIVEANAAVAQMFGYEISEILGKNFQELLLFKFSDFLDNFSKNSKFQEAIGLRKDQTFFPIEICRQTTIYKGKKVNISLIRDISKYKCTQHKLEESLSLLRATLDSTADGILVVNNSRKVTLYNRKFLEMWRIPDAVINSQKSSILLDFVLEQLKEPQVFLAKVIQLYNQPDAESFDVIEFKDGRVFERSSQPQRISGESVGRVWSFRDISEHKKVQKELEKSLCMLRATLESTADGILVGNHPGEISHYNRKFAEMWRIPEDILMSQNGKAATELVLSQLKNPQNFIDKVQQAYINPEIEQQDILEFKDGRIYERYCIPQRLENEIVGIVISFRDITERMRTEAALRQSEATNRALLNAIPDLIFRFRADGTYLDYKGGGNNPLEISPENLVGKNVFEILPREVAEQCYHYIQKALATDQLQIFEYQLIIKGKEYNYEARVAVCGESEVFAIVRDITLSVASRREKKQAREELQKSVSMHRATLESTADGILVVDTAGKISSFNQKLIEMWCLPDGFITLEQYKIYLKLAFKQLKKPQKLLQRFRYLQAKEQEVYLDWIEFKDGRIFEVYSQPQRLAGNIIGRAWSFRDITKRRLAEQELSRTQERFELLARTTNDAVWDWDRLTNRNWWGGGFRTLFGYDSNQIQPSYELWCQLIHPDDRERVCSFYQKAVDNKEPFISVEYRFQRANGTYAFVLDRCCFIHDATGKVIRSIGVMIDLTYRIQAEAELRESEERLRLALEAAKMGMWDWNIPSNDLVCSKQFLQLLGLPADSSLTYETFLKMVHPEDREMVRAIKEKAIENRTDYTLECRVLWPDGSTHWIAGQGKVYCGSNNLPVRMLGVSVDVTDRKHTELQLQQSQQMLQLVIDNIPQYIFWKDKNSVFLGCNRNYAELTGLNSPAEIAGKIDEDLPWHPEQIEFLLECERRVMATNTPEYHIIEPVLKPDGKQAWLDRNKIPLHDLEGNVVGILGTFEDITDRKQSEELIRYQATYDLLTGLPNRHLFNDRLQNALTCAAERGEMVAVMFLDLDRFKTINDTLGHATGDLLLQGVATRVSDCLRQQDTLARWGGDEFTLLIPHLTKLEDALKIAQRILDILKPAFHLESHLLHISSSIGIALYPHDGNTPELLLKNADTALYRAKEKGRNNYQLYTPAMNCRAGELLTIENNLYQALTLGEFVLHYHPQIDVSTGTLTGMEALLRWQHPEWGLIPPATFIPLAEENGLIVPLGRWVLQTACAQNKKWLDSGITPLRVAVNLSGRQFQQENLVEMISEILEQTGLPPQFLDLEITETVAMRDVNYTRNILAKLRANGVHLSMDDFGTGYASLSYLKNFPFDTLKIDRSFVTDLTINPTDAAIVKAIVSLGQELNLRVVVEGVETEEARDLLISLNCYEMQGFLFSKPLNSTSATALLNRPSSFSSPLSQAASILQFYS
ncbi:PAS domain S-box protein [Ancylothrix sp. C2]|uniref:PAS domain S-box protein n=1 Tax=Ancylothrix sp. D3o TaxID=2953691 RepID=UPI0021BB6352|nr:PAS domain S-box protein [Ancylothrix sp. D3o]MCT7949836.1 PAS domain S-box protein [Ancylothrix sp. D3o]